jgi:hypothetical protein
MTLNFDAFNEGSKKKSNSKYKAALGVSSVVGLFGIGSTLAANISLNGGGNVEFGQGVATTAACDEDGFTITPVTYFSNQWSVFLVDRVEVSGVNLTPEGTGYGLSGSGVVDQNADTTVDQSDAIEQFPGQYYDGSNWKRTCDNVVLDFKAYTDDVAYINKTVYNYGSPSEASLLKPIGWVQDAWSGAESTGNFAPGYALVIDMNNSGDGWESNYGTEDFFSDGNIGGNPGSIDWEMDSYLTPANSSFNFYVGYSGEKTHAASISKITVQSMKEFPRSYYAYRDNLGNPNFVD